MRSRGKPRQAPRGPSCNHGVGQLECVLPRATRRGGPNRGFSMSDATDDCESRLSVPRLLGTATTESIADTATIQLHGITRGQMSRRADKKPEDKTVPRQTARNIAGSECIGVPCYQVGRVSCLHHVHFLAQRLFPFHHPPSTICSFCLFPHTSTSTLLLNSGILTFCDLRCLSVQASRGLCILHLGFPFPVPLLEPGAYLAVLGTTNRRPAPRTSLNLGSRHSAGRFSVSSSQLFTFPPLPPP